MYEKSAGGRWDEPFRGAHANMKLTKIAPSVGTFDLRV